MESEWRRRWIEEIGFEARDPCVDKVDVEAMLLTDGKRKKLFGQSLEMASCSLQANVVNNLVTRTPEKRGCIFKGKSNIRLIYEELEGWYNTDDFGKCNARRGYFHEHYAAFGEKNGKVLGLF